MAISCHSFDAVNSAWMGARSSFNDLVTAALSSWGESWTRLVSV
jgi:hypothetical protein